ncbi:hypothetical protein [Rhizobium sp. MHM7A]|uniref:hypothetical protein n=1 Tax=Rhizobium sp. MHM7A TaxID=2583233 RepID=UPI0011070249|nr:hypothetical protein [Rhizobium sp. MHM7A]TLX15995.1 hypothetical protein FFR93_01370 [Rhizobium sp. MHM7A]
MSTLTKAIDFVWQNTRIGRKLGGGELTPLETELAAQLDDAMAHASAGRRIATIYAIGEIVRLLDG